MSATGSTPTLATSAGPANLATALPSIEDVDRIAHTPAPPPVPSPSHAGSGDDKKEAVRKIPKKTTTVILRKPVAAATPTKPTAAAQSPQRPPAAASSNTNSAVNNASHSQSQSAATVSNTERAVGSEVSGARGVEDDDEQDDEDEEDDRLPLNIKMAKREERKEDVKRAAPAPSVLSASAHSPSHSVVRSSREQKMRDVGQDDDEDEADDEEEWTEGNCSLARQQHRQSAQSAHMDDTKQNGQRTGKRQEETKEAEEEEEEDEGQRSAQDEEQEEPEEDLEPPPSSDEEDLEPPESSEEDEEDYDDTPKKKKRARSSSSKKKSSNGRAGKQKGKAVAGKRKKRKGNEDDDFVDDDEDDDREDDDDEKEEEDEENNKSELFPSSNYTQRSEVLPLVETHGANKCQQQIQNSVDGGRQAAGSQTAHTCLLVVCCLCRACAHTHTRTHTSTHSLRQTQTVVHTHVMLVGIPQLPLHTDALSVCLLTVRRVRWNRDSHKGKQKWETLEHNGVLFPPAYVPHQVPLLYEGEELSLSDEAEEVATMYAAMLELAEFIGNPTFNANFFKDWRSVMSKAERQRIQKLDKCNFTRIHQHVMAEREKKKAAKKVSALTRALNERSLRRTYSSAAYRAWPC